jgi:hypothetical protein
MTNTNCPENDHDRDSLVLSPAAHSENEFRSIRNHAGLTRRTSFRYRGAFRWRRREPQAGGVCRSRAPRTWSACCRDDLCSQRLDSTLSIFLARRAMSSLVAICSTTWPSISPSSLSVVSVAAICGSIAPCHDFEKRADATRHMSQGESCSALHHSPSLADRRCCTIRD